jgi:hypothetical protein
MLIEAILRRGLRRGRLFGRADQAASIADGFEAFSLEFYLHGNDVGIVTFAKNVRVGWSGILGGNTSKKVSKKQGDQARDLGTLGEARNKRSVSW